MSYREQLLIGYFVHLRMYLPNFKIWQELIDILYVKAYNWKRAYSIFHQTVSVTIEGGETEKADRRCSLTQVNLSN